MSRSRSAPQGLAALLVLAPLMAQAPAAPSQSLPEDRRDGAATVTADQCSTWLHTLASPEFEGRGTGQPGYRKAAEFVAAHFKALGLEARGDDGTYFQNVPWTTTKIDSEHSFVAVQKDGKEMLRVPADRLTGSVTASTKANAVMHLVVVAPVDPTSSGEQANEVPGLGADEVKDKVVVVAIQPSSDPRGRPVTRFAVLRALQGKSPAAVVFAQTEPAEGALRGRSGAGRAAGNPAAASAGRMPADVTLGGGDLTTLLAAAGLDRTALDTPGAKQGVPLTMAVELSTIEEQAPAMNVFGVLPGSDPKLRDEYVVLGSHLDHLGLQRGTLYPGADDDGSGSTGLLAIAQMMAKNKQRPARSILFVAFCGEEGGLRGSRFFADNCPIPLASIVGELQMDMIGRNEEEAHDGGRLVNQGETAEQNLNSLHLVGSQKLAPALHELCLNKNTAAGFALEYDQETMFGRSDHANFARHGVPIAFFFTGLHRDYHQPTDTPDKIDYPKLLRVATYVYDIAFELARQPGRPKIEPTLWQSYRGKAQDEPAAPMDGAPARKPGETVVR